MRKTVKIDWNKIRRELDDILREYLGNYLYFLIDHDFGNDIIALIRKYLLDGDHFEILEE